MNNQPIHICYTIDTKYVKLCCMSIHDVCLHKADTTSVVFHILLDRVDDYQLFFAFNNIAGVDVRVYPMDATKLVGDISIDSPVKSHAIALRLFIPFIQNFDGISRLLYLDSDVMARRDLTNLYNFDLYGYPIGWVKDQIGIEVDLPTSRPIKQYTHKDFFANAGIILMDLDKLRASPVPNNWINMYKQVCSNDQIVLNHFHHDNSWYLPPTCNLFYQHFLMRIKNINDLTRWNKYHNTGYESIEEIINQSYLWHFADEKPWILRNPTVGSLFARWEERCDDFFRTGNLTPWTNQDKQTFLINNVNNWYTQGEINEHVFE